MTAEKRRKRAKVKAKEKRQRQNGQKRPSKGGSTWVPPALAAFGVFGLSIW